MNLYKRPVTYDMLYVSSTYTFALVTRKLFYSPSYIERRTGASNVDSNTQYRPEFSFSLIEDTLQGWLRDHRLASLSKLLSL